MTCVRWIIVAAVGGFLSNTALADGFFLGLGHLPSGSAFSKAWGVSADGSTVVGHGYTHGTEAFRWTPADGMVGLGFLPPSFINSMAFGASADGTVVVGVADGHVAYEAFRWTASTGMVSLGFLPGGGFYGSWAHATSADGSVVVGFSDTASVYMQAFRWTSADGMVALPDLPGGNEFSEAIGVTPDGAVMVGQGTSPDGIEACRWIEGKVFGLGSLPGGEYRSMARAVSADGDVIVGASRSEASGPDNWEMFLWTDEDGMIGLGDLPGGEFNSYAYDLSADGSVIAGVGSSEQGFEAVVWDTEHGLRTLYDILTADLGLDLSGWTLTSAHGVSADGRTIVGYGTNPDGNTEAWIAQIPEPATIWLLALAVTTVARRRH